METPTLERTIFPPGHPKYGQDRPRGMRGKRGLGALVFVANGVSFTELGACVPAGGCPPEGRYYSSDSSSGFGPPPLFSSLEQDYREVTWPGVNGITTKTFGERGLMITASLVYIAASKVAAMAFLTSDFCTTFPQQARYTVTMPDGVDFGGCKLLRGGAGVATWGPAMNAMSVALIKAVWKQFDVDAYGVNAP